ncbi:hypothetical protein D1872_299670 [compost metagenome]
MHSRYTAPSLYSLHHELYLLLQIHTRAMQYLSFRLCLGNQFIIHKRIGVEYKIGLRQNPHAFDGNQLWITRTRTHDIHLWTQHIRTHLLTTIRLRYSSS